MCINKTQDSMGDWERIYATTRFLESSSSNSKFKEFTSITYPYFLSTSTTNEVFQFVNLEYEKFKEDAMKLLKLMSSKSELI